MANSPLANPPLAYALLKAAYSDNVRNPADVTLPLIKRSLFKYGKDVLRPDIIQNKIRRVWGLELPLNIITYSFPQLEREGIVRRIDQQYEMVNSQYSDPTIVEKEQASRHTYSLCVSRLDEVIDNLQLHNVSGADVLEGWLDSSSLSFLGGLNPASSADKNDRTTQRIVASALFDYEFSSDFQRDLAQLCLGDSLYRAVKSLSEYDADELKSTDLRQKMNQMDVYFDTPFLIRVLGFSRLELNHAAAELLEMCKVTGCHFRIFEHTLEELRGIIRRAAGTISDGWRFDTANFVGGDFIAHALERGLQAADLIELAAGVQDDLTQRGIEITPAPRIEDNLSLDEKRLDISLRVGLRSQTDLARAVDVNSLAAIYRLRGGRPMRHLENSLAIFITTNKGLSDTTTSFFQKHFRDEGHRNVVPLCMTDVVFATRLWPKLPTPSQLLPTSQIIAHSLSSLIPSPLAVSSFLKHVRKLVSGGKLTERSAAILQVSRFLDESLCLELESSKMELTEDEAVRVGRRVVREQDNVMEALVEKRVAGIVQKYEDEVALLRKQLDATPTEVIVLIHGINTYAHWEPVIKKTLESHQFKVAPTSFGFFSAFKFLMPIPWFRRAAVERVVRNIRLARQLNRDCRMSVIAHSFGTDVMGRILLDYPELKWHRIIFCGSVLRDTYPMAHAVERFTHPLINEIGTRDYWPVLAASAGWYYGSIGSHGLNSPAVENCWHQDFKHSDFFTKEFCEKYWIPFLESGRIVEGDEVTNVPLKVRLIARVPLRYALAILIIGAVALTLRTLYVTAL